MKIFFKKASLIIMGILIVIVGAVSNLNVENNEVKAMGYNTQLNNNNYTTLAYTGNLFGNYVYVLTTDTTTTLQDFWDYELSSDFSSYLNGGGFILERIYVDDIVSANNTIVSSFSIGSHSIKFYYEAGPVGEYSPIETFTVEAPAPTCTASLTGNLSITSYSNYEPSTSPVANITDDLIYEIAGNVSNVVYTNSACATQSVSPTITISPTITFGNNTYTATFTYSGVSFSKSITFNWYYDAPPVCTPYLTISISNGLELPYTSATISENDLISELISYNDGFIGSYTNSSCVSGNIDVSTSVVDLVDYIQLLVGNNTIQFNVSYQGLSLTKNINVVLLASSGGIEQDYFNLKDMILFIMATPINLISGIFDFTIFGFNFKNLLFVLFSISIIVFVISFLKGKRGE